MPPHSLATAGKAPNFNSAGVSAHDPTPGPARDLYGPTTPGSGVSADAILRTYPARPMDMATVREFGARVGIDPGWGPCEVNGVYCQETATAEFVSAFNEAAEMLGEIEQEILRMGVQAQFKKWRLAKVRLDAADKREDFHGWLTEFLAPDARTPEPIRARMQIAAGLDDFLRACERYLANPSTPDRPGLPHQTAFCERTDSFVRLIEICETNQTSQPQTTRPNGQSSAA